MEGEANAMGGSSPNTSVTPMRFLFESTDIVGDVVFDVRILDDLEINLFIHSIKILDAKNGDIAFPKGSTSATTEQKSDATEPADAP
jgi:hypothetical protein